jgi:hypothetical protein
MALLAVVVDGAVSFMVRSPPTLPNSVRLSDTGSMTGYYPKRA